MAESPRDPGINVETRDARPAPALGKMATSAPKIFKTALPRPAHPENAPSF